ncbi:hypothetical protein SKAU_G00119670 [Synaphobranchus kaupii]|uniref:Uncharacterized protein n=1 Tax=Synaphobranchus kaupii TaxID=118154 RepID=A0A9Q1FNT3_SYNKA|nr:hypothetical protein SKAU_G00119670 [Synaphobranchus kaupii]
MDGHSGAPLWGPVASIVPSWHGPRERTTHFISDHLYWEHKGTDGLHLQALKWAFIDGHCKSISDSVATTYRKQDRPVAVASIAAVEMAV